MIKKGIVIGYENNKAILMTNEGEFISINSKENLEIGQEYVYRAKKIYNFKGMLIAASIALFVFSSLLYNMYFTVYAAITVSINPKIRFEINRFERIIKVLPLNEDAQKIISDIKLTNKKLDNGLVIFVNKAKEKNYITEEYYEGKSKSIEVTLDEKKVNLSEFYSEIKKQKLNLTTRNFKVDEKNNKKNKDNGDIDKIKNKPGNKYKINQDEIKNKDKHRDKYNKKIETFKDKGKDKGKGANTKKELKEDNKKNNKMKNDKEKRNIKSK